jgi:hypothetical protein
LWKNYAVAVVAQNARAVTLIPFGLEQIVGGDQANTRAFLRPSSISDGVYVLILEIRDSRIFDSPFLVRRVARDGGPIQNLVDALPV